jgi:hypothetical protein
MSWHRAGWLLLLLLLSSGFVYPSTKTHTSNSTIAVIGFVVVISRWRRRYMLPRSSQRFRLSVVDPRGLADRRAFEARVEGLACFGDSSGFSYHGHCFRGKEADDFTVARCRGRRRRHVDLVIRVGVGVGVGVGLGRWPVLVLVLVLVELLLRWTRAAGSATVLCTGEGVDVGTGCLLDWCLGRLSWGVVTC